MRKMNEQITLYGIGFFALVLVAAALLLAA
jgi:hypothetical protein